MKTKFSYLISLIAAGASSALAQSFIGNLTPSVGQTGVFAYWNFNSLSIGTASNPGSGGVPTSISSNFGSATVSLAGWAGTVDDFAGATLNAQNLGSGVDVAGASLSLIAGGVSAPFPGNGSSILFNLNLTSYADLTVSFDTRGTSTGFNANTWAYSVDGGSFTTIAGVSTATRTTTFATASFSLSAISAIENQSNVVLRYTVDGATSGSGNNRIDNLTIAGTYSPAAAIPEPSTYAAILGGVALLGVAARRRRSV